MNGKDRRKNIQIVIDYSALQYRKSQIVSTIHKLADEPELDIAAINVLTKQYAEIKDCEELALKYGMPEAGEKNNG